MQKRRFIVHVDMDAFFAAIEERDNPKLRGRPVIVGADPKGGRGRGVVSTCSYEARRFGIHSAMPISKAYRRCPQAVYLPVDIEKYESVSSEIYRILYDFTPDIEPISIDEAFLDISGSYHLFGASTSLPSTPSFDPSAKAQDRTLSLSNHSADGEYRRTIGAPLDTCRLIKSKIKESTRLTASVGLAPTKMAAKIASDLKKPDGLVEVTRDGLLDFLRPLEIRRIWGLGEKSAAVLNDMGIGTIGDLAKRDKEELITIFGKSGAHFWDLANGIDERRVEAESESKSVSNEITFERDTGDDDMLDSALMSLSEKVSSRLRRENLKARTITLKIRLKGFSTYTRSVTISESTNFFDVIYKEIKSLYNDFDKDGKMVRLVGVRASNLISRGQMDSLFDNKIDGKKEDIHKALDSIKKKFGDGSIYRAGSKVKGSR